MTRLPGESWNVIGLDSSDELQYVTYKVGPICSVPGCSRLADHAHHIWRRSFVIGDKPWVKYEDGTITGNLVGLCWRHHEAVTVNKAWIRWTGEVYAWDAVLEDDGHSYTGAHLDPQPPILRPGATSYEVSQDDVSPPKGEAHMHGPGSVESCPTCKRALPREKRDKDAPKRPRQSWVTTVPVDERENGANVLDSLITECARIFGHEATANMRYFTLVQALALVVQHQDQMASDG